jgi:hypothetical protein
MLSDRTRKISQYRKSDNWCHAKTQVTDRPSCIAGSSMLGSDHSGKGSRLSGDTRDVLLINSADNAIDATNWRAPIINYLCNPSIRTDRNVWRTTFKYVLVDDELYRQSIGDVLLRCLGPNDAILAKTEVHDEICGTHQSAPKMKWLLRRSGFYWLDMITDCFQYYRGC